MSSRDTLEWLIGRRDMPGVGGDRPMVPAQVVLANRAGAGDAICEKMDNGKSRLDEPDADLAIHCTEPGALDMAGPRPPLRDRCMIARGLGEKRRDSGATRAISWSSTFFPPVVPMPASAYALVSFFWNLVALALYTAFLVVALTVVRKRRPDAWGWLAAGASLRLAGALATWVLRSFVFAAVDSSEGRTTFMVATSLLELLITVVWYALLVAGVVALTREPPGERPVSF